MNEEISETITKLRLAIERLDFQVGRLVSDKESEKERQKERNHNLDQSFKEFKDILYNPDNGMLVAIDRLKTSNKNMTKVIWILIGAIVSGGIGLVINWISHKS